MRKTIFVPIIKDEGGDRYIPFCRFRWHPGVSKDYRTCERRHCNHYKRLYLSKYHDRQDNAPQGGLNGLVGQLGDGI